MWSLAPRVPGIGFIVVNTYRDAILSRKLFLTIVIVLRVLKCIDQYSHLHKFMSLFQFKIKYTILEFNSCDDIFSYIRISYVCYSNKVSYQNVLQLE